MDKKHEPIVAIDRLFFDLVISKMKSDGLTPDEAIGVIARFRCLDKAFLLEKVRSGHSARYEALYEVQKIIAADRLDKSRRM